MAFIGIDTLYSITLQATARALEVVKTQTVETVKKPSVAGEWTFFKAKKSAKVEIVISGIGPAALDSVTAATPAFGDKKLIKSQQGETVTGDGNATFTNTYAYHEAFDDAGGVASAGGDEPDIDTLCEIVGVTYADAQTLTRSFEVTDKLITRADGTPGARATLGRVGMVSMDFAGDIPSGVALGSDGVNAAGMAGRLIVGTLVERQQASEFNGGNLSAEVCALAS
jgi:hypothetical protein